VLAWIKIESNKSIRSKHSELLVSTRDAAREFCMFIAGDGGFEEAAAGIESYLNLLRSRWGCPALTINAVT
jgi:predicted methyltransferase